MKSRRIKVTRRRKSLGVFECSEALGLLASGALKSTDKYLIEDNGYFLPDAKTSIGLMLTPEDINEMSTWVPITISQLQSLAEEIRKAEDEERARINHEKDLPEWLRGMRRLHT